MAGRNQEVPEPLEALIARGMDLLGVGAGDPPPITARDGQTRADWEAEVRLIRARHDGAALSVARFLARESAEILGASETDPTVSSEWSRLSDPERAVDLRIYRPRLAGPLPAILVVHGGAYWMGGGAAGWEINDPLCRLLAAEVGAVVINVDHRLAPEYRFPAPSDDVLAAFDETVERATEWNIDPTRIALLGMSSGGNLVASATHTAHDRGGVQPAALVLQTPSVDLSGDSARLADGDPNAAAVLRRIVELYVGDTDPADPRVSPGLRIDLTDLPPTLVVTAQFDPLAADAAAFARRLDRAGVTVAHRSYPMTHTVALPEVARQLNSDNAAWLREVLAG